MITHINVIITAVILLVTAFAALIICMCVDIIPIIKSRGSTLVSRDSITKDQTRKLKKSLQRRNKNSEKDAVFEQTEAPAKLETHNQLDENVSSNPVVTKLTNTSTTATVLVEASSLGNEASHVQTAAPEGDKSTQQNSSASSSLSQNENHEHESITYEAETYQINWSSGKHVTPVVVSVHNNMNDRLPLPHKHGHARAHSFDLCKISRDELENYNRDHSMDGNLSAPNSPKTASIRKRLPMVSQSKRWKEHPTTLLPMPTCNNATHGSLAESFLKQQPQIKCCSKDKQIVSRSLSMSPDAEMRRSSLSPVYSSDGNSSTKAGCSTDTDRDISPAPPYQDYHDAPWDVSHQEPHMNRESVGACKWCYLDHLEHKRKHALRDRANNSSLVIKKCNPSTNNAANRKHWKDRRDLSVDDQKQYDHNTQSLQMHAKHHIGNYQTQTMRNSPITIACLHGTGIRQRNSPLSSSGSPSPSSLSSHSGQRSHRTRLEDIKEDTSCSEEDCLIVDSIKHENETNTSTAHAKPNQLNYQPQQVEDASMIETPNSESLLHSFAPFDERSIISQDALTGLDEYNTSDAQASSNLQTSTKTKRSHDTRHMNQQHFMFDMKTAIEGVVTGNGA